VTPVEHLLVVGGGPLRKSATPKRKIACVTCLAKPVDSEFTDKRWFPSGEFEIHATNDLVFRFGYAKSDRPARLQRPAARTATITDPVGTHPRK